MNVSALYSLQKGRGRYPLLLLLGRCISQEGWCSAMLCGMLKVGLRKGPEMSWPSTAAKETIPAVTILHTTTSRLLKPRDHTPPSSIHNVFSACNELSAKSILWMSRHCNRVNECRFSGCRAIAIVSTHVASVDVASIDVAPLQSLQRMSLQWMSSHCNRFNGCRFNGQNLWSVETVFWHCPSQLIKYWNGTHPCPF